MHSGYQSLIKTKLEKTDIAWLKAIRQQGADDFARLGFPDRRQEAWKYTSVSALLEYEFVAEERVSFKTRHEYIPITSTVESIRQRVLKLTRSSAKDLNSSCLVFINGCYSPQLSNISETGAVICDLGTAIKNYAELIKPQLNQHVKTEHGFTALNTALFNDGAFIYVPANVKIKEPIHLVFLGDASDTKWMGQLRNVIVTEQGSEVSVVEHYIGCKASIYWHNSITEANVGKEAKVQHYKLQQESQTAFHTATVFAELAESAQFNSYSLALGGRLVRSDTYVKQLATMMDCELNGLYLGKEQQHIDHHTLVDHAYPKGSSKEFYKGIVLDEAKAVFNGRVMVRPDAQETKALQMNKNLVLSDHADINTKPELEIYADNVQCSHGATVGQLDNNALFYLRSRGLSEQQARQLLISAFAMEVINQWPSAELRDYAQQLIEEVL